MICVETAHQASRWMGHGIEANPMKTVHYNMQQNSKNGASCVFLSYYFFVSVFMNCSAWYGRNNDLIMACTIFFAIFAMFCTNYFSYGTRAARSDRGFQRHGFRRTGGDHRLRTGSPGQGSPFPPVPQSCSQYIPPQFYAGRNRRLLS